MKKKELRRRLATLEAEYGVQTEWCNGLTRSNAELRAQVRDLTLTRQMLKDKLREAAPLIFLQPGEHDAETVTETNEAINAMADRLRTANTAYDALSRLYNELDQRCKAEKRELRERGDDFYKKWNAEQEKRMRVEALVQNLDGPQQAAIDSIREGRATGYRLRFDEWPHGHNSPWPGVVLYDCVKTNAPTQRKDWLHERA